METALPEEFSDREAIGFNSDRVVRDAGKQGHVWDVMVVQRNAHAYDIRQSRQRSGGPPLPGAADNDAVALVGRNDDLRHGHGPLARQ
jgi:hypothetical protein